MKRWFRAVLLASLVLLLIRTPEYWKIFRQDKNEYKTDTFYYVIKEEYQEDAEGKRLYQSSFSDVQDGDILVTDSTYCFCFRHGHAALVLDAEKGITLEAFGIGTESEYASLQAWRRYPHVLVLRLKAPQNVRQAVVEYARANLIGIPYMLSPGVIDDKDMDGVYWGTQCAHLVWIAFEAFGYDIDGDGGWLVTPADFVESDWLKIVPQN